MVSLPLVVPKFGLYRCNIFNTNQGIKKFFM